MTTIRTSQPQIPISLHWQHWSPTFEDVNRYSSLSGSQQRRFLGLVDMALPSNHELKPRIKDELKKHHNLKHEDGLPLDPELFAAISAEETAINKYISTTQQTRAYARTRVVGSYSK